MKSSRWLGLAVIWAASACNLYNDGLLDEAFGDDGPSGGADTGGNDSGGAGGDGDGGGPDSGGNTSGGGTSGGTGGDDTGGGGTDTGGEGGTGGDTGGNSGGGTGGGDGGSGGGDGGTGGGSGGGGPLIGLIDDFSDTSANYSNLPFYGSWSRYLQPSPAMWTAASVSAMMQPRPDDSEDGAFHVQATALDDWGLGTFVTLKGSGLPVNLTGVTGIKFWVISMNDEPTLRVALADVNSHRTDCEEVNGGVDCDKHMRTVEVFALTTDWQEVTLPLDSFIDNAVATPPREAALDLTQVYAIHFQMDTELVEEEADFYIDDLEAY